MADERIRTRATELTALQADDSFAGDPATGTAGRMFASTMGLLETEVVAAADADIPGVVGVEKFVSLGSFSTDRNFTLPATAKVGERCAVTLQVGHATHRLLIKNDTGDTINGTDHSSTEKTSLFIAYERMVFRCIVANTDWVVEEDGRIPCQFGARDSTGQTISTYAALQCNDELKDIGDVYDPSGYDFTVRRNAPGWLVGAFVRVPNQTIGQSILLKLVEDPDGTPVDNMIISVQYVASSTSGYSQNTAYLEDPSAGTVYDIQCNAASSGTTSTTLNVRTRVFGIEQLTR